MPKPNRDRALTDGELLSDYGWWERNRDRDCWDNYRAMEFASMVGRLFATLEKRDPVGFGMALRKAIAESGNGPTPVAHDEDGARK